MLLLQGVTLAYQIIIVKLWLFLNMKLSEIFFFFFFFTVLSPCYYYSYICIIANVCKLLYVQESIWGQKKFPTSLTFP